MEIMKFFGQMLIIQTTTKTMTVSKLDRNIELKQVNDAMIWQAKTIYILTIKVRKFFFIFLLRYFLKQIENMLSVLLSSYRKTCESL